jgi:hypothetical protein
VDKCPQISRDVAHNAVKVLEAVNPHNNDASNEKLSRPGGRLKSATNQIKRSSRNSNPQSDPQKVMSSGQAVNSDRTLGSQGHITG